jgi:hypothetical protein
MTPQQNHLAGLGFATLANRGRALIYHANIPLIVRYKVFKEAFTTAILLDGFMPIEIAGTTSTTYYVGAVVVGLRHFEKHKRNHKHRGICSTYFGKQLGQVDGNGRN